MKKSIQLLVLACVTAVGCQNTPKAPTQSAQPPVAKAAPVAAEPVVRNVVQPEQVNEGNAHAMYQALWKELDQDAQGDTQAAALDARPAPAGTSSH